MNPLISLDKLSVGKHGTLRQLLADGVTRRRLLDLGLVQNTPVKALYKSPAGDPIAYEIRGTVIALRSEEASQIMVECQIDKEETI
ncbi:ferrous iron transport protein A [Vallitalea pronyensis]|uniref:Ferrous iron transport protein A n=1 Tax=Vallitalea pronyensis TaxID=1348613 RepID=A0A8J8MIQ6_9FIRM|nr:FeoA family protein [Vallitalea pronyensis]QUI22023.1 ferrous iron transport protein A [Vallitalea pronyensis]